MLTVLDSACFLHFVLADWPREHVRRPHSQKELTHAGADPQSHSSDLTCGRSSLSSTPAAALVKPGYESQGGCRCRGFRVGPDCEATAGAGFQAQSRYCTPTERSGWLTAFSHAERPARKGAYAGHKPQQLPPGTPAVKLHASKPTTEPTTSPPRRSAAFRLMWLLLLAWASLAAQQQSPGLPRVQVI